MSRSMVTWLFHMGCLLSAATFAAGGAVQTYTGVLGLTFTTGGPHGEEQLYTIFPEEGPLLELQLITAKAVGQAAGMQPGAQVSVIADAVRSNATAQVLMVLEMQPLPDDAKVQTRTTTVYTDDVSIKAQPSPSGGPVFLTYAGNGQGGPFRFRSAVLIVTLCGQRPLINKEDIANLYLSSPSSIAWTVQRTLETCSNGKITFSTADNMIIENIQVGCRGSTWSASTCTSKDHNGWGEEAVRQAATMGYDLSSVHHRILVLPESAPCSWTGAGQVGCFAGSRGCYTWLRGTYGVSKEAYLHEMGHNMGLDHSAVPRDEYGDMSSPMGYCCDSPRCYNAPQQWQLGWTSEVAALTTLDPGRWVKYMLFALAAAEKAVIRLKPAWDAASPAYFVSYRMDVGADAGLNGPYVPAINVHTFNGSQLAVGTKPYLVGLVPARGSWTSDSSGFTVRLFYTNYDRALVGLCRVESAAETNCVDGLDNDCNGLTDDEDPACKTASVPGSCNNNRVCESNRGESAGSCPNDCPARCGDRFCDRMRGESLGSCPNDCAGTCGDGVCDHNREDFMTCRADCPAPRQQCGDGICRATVEDFKSCPIDCCAKNACGDGRCDAWRGETCTNCPQDCAGSRSAGFCCGVGGADSGCEDARCSAGAYECRKLCAPWETVPVTPLDTSSIDATVSWPAPKPFVMRGDPPPNSPSSRPPPPAKYPTPPKSPLPLKYPPPVPRSSPPTKRPPPAAKPPPPPPKSSPSPSPHQLPPSGRSPQPFPMASLPPHSGGTRRAPAPPAPAGGKSPPPTAAGWSPPLTTPPPAPRQSHPTSSEPSPKYPLPPLPLKTFPPPPPSPKPAPWLPLPPRFSSPSHSPPSPLVWSSPPPSPSRSSPPFPRPIAPSRTPGQPSPVPRNPAPPTPPPRPTRTASRPSGRLR